MYSLVFYVPETHLEAVKRAVFAAGAGKMGNYEHACWQVKGQGQFQPKVGATPYVGDVGRLEVVSEYRVEMVLMASCREQVVRALKLSHPYEEVAYQISAIEH
ncbi:NGG1p interacting factor NIF3 [Marinomonas piezotolerans]|uniref:NGG1p interacting factor NIF3 n=1 Tax=Marinomonas piezotolerans TaxID=2213058 RepID=A0A370U4W5_9GAMM|nr:NGG1p interacting factor NIF3 [Marinomonas piezotolerans]RDL42778.1 NGG1p interacting factor NIF3 [Marinomonas piezotolerans]